jgi:hypothetical protein
VLGQRTDPRPGDGVTAEPFSTRLRGLDEEQHLVWLTGTASRAVRA